MRLIQQTFRPNFLSRSSEKYRFKISNEMFNKEEAINYLQCDRGVTNVEKKLQSNRKDLLDEIILFIHGRVPFQFTTLCELWAIPPEKRVYPPSIEAIRMECVTGNGGPCLFINLFTSCLLEALDFSVRLCISMVSSTILNPHVVILVDNLEKNGDVHLVDCGLGFPTFHAITLNFDQESPVYRESFLEYKFIRHDGLILRMHGDGDLVKRNDPPVKGLDFLVGKWRQFYHFDVMSSVSRYDLSGINFNAYNLPRIFQPRAVWFPQRRAVMILLDQLVVEQEDGTLEKTKMKSDEEILRCYKQYFPTIREDTVLPGYSAWRQKAIFAKL